MALLLLTFLDYQEEFSTILPMLVLIEIKLYSSDYVWIKIIRYFKVFIHQN